MTQSSIQASINQGYAQLATVLGAPYAWFRPVGAVNPLAAANQLGTLQAHLDPSPNFDAKKPPAFAKPVWAVAADRTQLAVGDYLVGQVGTFFLTSMEPMLPTAAVLCNAVLNVYRPGGQQRVGSSYYGGNPQGYGTPLLTAWPASVLTGTKGEASQSGVMGDARIQWLAIILPVLPAGVLIEAADLIVDQTCRRMIVSAVEATEMGVRLTAQYGGT